jgi:hypothetical protein
MPFTASHPAIILPLLLTPRYFSLTGLVIGSMAPDFEYFLRMKPQAVHGHTVAGLFYFDLPLALLLTFLFHNVVRNALIENLPIFFKSRFINAWKFDWNIYFKQKWLIVLCSIIIGSASHLFWDGFTHKTGFFISHNLELLQTVSIGGVNFPYYNILQHISTLVGAIVIMVTIFNMPRFDVAIDSIWKYWTIVCVTTVIVVLIRILSGTSLQQYGILVVSTISGFLLSLVTTKFFIKSNGR